MPPQQEIRIVLSLACCLDSTGVRRVSQEFVVRPGENRYLGKHTIGPQSCSIAAGEKLICSARKHLFHGLVF
jgi:hypothetical protein